jgi:AraC-like DNA-binding protein
MLTTDPLSDVLALVNAKSILSAHLRTGGNWSIRFPSTGVKFNAVMQGRCFLMASALDAPVPLQVGDCLLLNQCDEYILCSDPALAPVDARGLFQRNEHGASYYDAGTGSDFLAIGGHIDFEAIDRSLLLDALPPVLHVDGQLREAEGIRWLLGRLQGELTIARPGAGLAFEHLAQLLFVEAVRVWLHSAEGPTSGWLRALLDRRIGVAIRLLHSDPKHNWRLQELAEASGMSRSNFAPRFKQLCGLAPLEYLVRWRMQLGAKTLRSSVQPISVIAYSLGYQSESAFSSAFKRATGLAPQQYRIARRLAGQTEATHHVEGDEI